MIDNSDQACHNCLILQPTDRGLTEASLPSYFKARIGDARFVNNSVSGVGGAVYISSSKTVIGPRTVFISNQAGDRVPGDSWYVHSSPLSSLDVLLDAGCCPCMSQGKCM